MSSRPGVVFQEPVNRPGERLAFRQPARFAAGLVCRQIVVINAQLILAGELDIDEVIVFDPRQGGDLDADDVDALHLGGATGGIGEFVALETGQDQAKVGRGTHDLVIGSWFGRAKPRDSIVHQDGFQFMNAQRVTVERADYESPTGNNAGLWFNPISTRTEDNSQNPNLVVDCVCLGGRILNNMHGVHLGPSTRCGARDTLLVGKRPFASLPEAPVIDPVDSGNQKIRVREGLAGYAPA